MAEENRKSVAKIPDAVSKKPADAVGQEKTSFLRWLVGWVLIPGFVIAVIVATGAYVGANHPNSWITRAVMWTINLFL